MIRCQWILSCEIARLTEMVIGKSPKQCDDFQIQAIYLYFILIRLYNILSAIKSSNHDFKNYETIKTSN